MAKYTVEFMNLTVYRVAVDATSPEHAIEIAENGDFDLNDLDTVGEPENDYYEVIEKDGVAL